MRARIVFPQGRRVGTAGYTYSGNLYTCTVCPRNLDPFYAVSYYLFKLSLFKTSWTDSNTRNYNVIFIHCILKNIAI